MKNEYTFHMEETVTYDWLFTCQAASAEEAFSIAKDHMRSDVAQWARRKSPPPMTGLAQRINGTFLPDPAFPAATPAATEP